MEAKTDEVTEKKYTTANYDYAVRISRSLLRFTGSWPEDHVANKSSFKYMGSKCLNLITFVTMVLFIVPIFLEIVFIKEVIYMFLLNISFLIYFGSSLTKYILFHVLKHRMIPLLQEVHFDWKEANLEHKKIMVKTIGTGRSLIIVCVIFMYLGVIGWDLKSLTEPRLIIDNQTHYPLTFPGDCVFINVHRPPYYVYLATIQTIGCFFGLTIMVSTLSLAVCLITHVGGQYAILNYEIKSFEITRETETKYMRHFFPKFVKRHIRLIRFSSMTDRIYDSICFTEWINCVNGICICAIQLVTKENNFMNIFNYLIDGMINSSFMFYIYCYLGEHLQEYSLNVGKAINSSNWYNVKYPLMRNCLMMIFISQYPRKLSAMKIIVLSMNTFCEVMNRAFALISLLKTMT